MQEFFEAQCECGTIGRAEYREKDSPYSSHAWWEFSDVDTLQARSSAALSVSLTDALLVSQPTCKKCGYKFSENDFIHVT